MTEKSQLVEQAFGTAERLQENIGKVIFGKEREIRLALVPFLWKRHLHLEDVPGTAKTVFAKALVRSVGGITAALTGGGALEAALASENELTFARVQGLADLMPQDVTGWLIYNPKTNEWEFHQGPVFANILLVDEINRASPRGIQGLLEAMAEGYVTIDGRPTPLPDPFFVIATSNPVEFAATFEMGEAQMDRFMMQLEFGYPSVKAEVENIAKQLGGRHPLDSIEAVVDLQELRELQKAVTHVYISQVLQEWIVRLVQKTRPTPSQHSRSEVKLGASARGSERLVEASRAWAFLNGRTFVYPDDIVEVILPVLGHRIDLHPDHVRKYNNEREAMSAFLNSCLEAVPLESIT